jgi:hypothetical protein
MGNLWKRAHPLFLQRMGMRDSPRRRVSGTGGGKSEAGGLDGTHSTACFMIEGNEYNLFLKVLKNSEKF